MTVKELTACIALGAGAITGSGSILLAIYKHFTDQIRVSELNMRDYHLEDKAVELEGVGALYEARLSFEGELSPADRNRYDTVLKKLDAVIAARALIQQELRELR